jgi:hypothetical protein
MRFPDAAKFILLTALVVGMNALGARSARAAQPYCPNPSHQHPKPVPANLAARVGKALQIDAAMVKSATFVRCVGPTLMGCTIGANLVCGKADTRRNIPGATAWCHNHPGSDFIPLSATGHATIYDWSCAGRRAVPGKVLVAVDPRGYIAENWKKVP